MARVRDARRSERCTLTTSKDIDSIEVERAVAVPSTAFARAHHLHYRSDTFEARAIRGAHASGRYRDVGNFSSMDAGSERLRCAVDCHIREAKPVTRRAYRPDREGVP